MSREFNHTTILLLGAFAVSSAFVAVPRPAAAMPAYPWCARYFDRSGATACYFTSKPQCMAEVSGRGGFCLENPAVPAYGMYQGNRRVPGGSHRRHVDQD